MPPKAKFTKEQIIDTALSIVRSEGLNGLTARSLAAKLGSSPRPIFTVFQNMEEVQSEVLRAGEALYQECIRNTMAEGKYPPYKASGIAYIRFAQDEKELFRLLFMRDRSREKAEKNSDLVSSLIELIRKNNNLSEQDALLFHLEMWVFVHGIAVMAVTSYYEWTEELISRVLTDGYEGLKKRYCREEKNIGCNQSNGSDKEIQGSDSSRPSESDD